MVDPVLALAVASILCAVGIATFWAPWGVYWQWRRLRGASERVLIEDALKHFYHAEAADTPATRESLAEALGVSLGRADELMTRLEKLGMVRAIESACELTPAGRRDALRVIRVHRLLEKYLAEHSGWNEAEWHSHAEHREHLLSEAQAEALAAAMGNPRFDPHGDPIPTASGDIGPARGQPLGSLEVGQSAVIVHVEDEPPAVYAQLIAQGLNVGVAVRVLEATPERIRLEAGGEEQVLAPMVGVNLTVVPMTETPSPAVRSRQLSELSPGDRARVVAIAPACHGLQRRRLLDLGLVPGTVVEAEFQSASGDPTAYRIRGAMIALRRNQADLIHVAEATNGVFQ